MTDFRKLHLKDYIKMEPALSIDEIIKRTEDGFERCQELEIVRNFVVENAEGILEDCR